MEGRFRSPWGLVHGQAVRWQHPSYRSVARGRTFVVYVLGAPVPGSCQGCEEERGSFLLSVSGGSPVLRAWGVLLLGYCFEL